MILKCPICKQIIRSTCCYYQEKCPVLNNVLYDSLRNSLLAVTGKLNIKQCQHCGFMFNADFNPDLMSYEKDYNSSRSNSTTYNNYLSSLVKTIKNKIDLNSNVLEIGSGDGSFLKQLSAETSCFCWGYDPSYKKIKNLPNNIKFNDEVFDPEKNKIQFDVIIFRHILEHMWKPYHFLKNLINNKVLKKNAIIIVEVPDLNWIISSHSFFDFTYEHCNYFNYSSMYNLFYKLKIQPIEKKIVFQNQYLLVFGVWTQKKQLNILKNNSNITIDFRQRLEKKKKDLIHIVESADEICIWGASGKGVILLSSFQQEVIEKVNFVIDIDPLKQGKFLPVSGKKVLAPDALIGIKKVVTVLVMNPIYKDEIQWLIDKMGIKAQLILV